MCCGTMQWKNKTKTNIAVTFNKSWSLSKLQANRHYIAKKKFYLFNISHAANVNKLKGYESLQRNQL